MARANFPVMARAMARASMSCRKVKRRSSAKCSTHFFQNSFTLPATYGLIFVPTVTHDSIIRYFYHICYDTEPKQAEHLQLVEQ